MTKRIFEIESVLSENFLLFCEIFIGISFLQAIIWYSISRFIKQSVRKNKKIEYIIFCSMVTHHKTIHKLINCKMDKMTGSKIR